MCLDATNAPVINQTIVTEHIANMDFLFIQDPLDLAAFSESLDEGGKAIFDEIFN